VSSSSEEGAARSPSFLELASSPFPSFPLFIFLPNLSCVVARRPDALKEVVAECKGVLFSTPSRLASYDGRRKEAFRTEEEAEKLVLGVVGNVSDVDDMVRVREEVEKGEHSLLLCSIFSTCPKADLSACLPLVSHPAFGGIDTVLIVAGVSATRPFLSIAGSTMTPFKKEDGPTVINKKSRVRAGATGREGIEKVVDSARLVRALSLSFFFHTPSPLFD